MRKDIFIVGARLLGIWELLGAVSSLAWLIANWMGYLQMQPSNKEYTAIHFIIQFLTGIFLLFRTDRLYDFVNRITGEGKIAEQDSEQ